MYIPQEINAQDITDIIQACASIVNLGLVVYLFYLTRKWDKEKTLAAEQQIKLNDINTALDLFHMVRITEGIHRRNAELHFQHFCSTRISLEFGTYIIHQFTHRLSGSDDHIQEQLYIKLKAYKEL